jgi:chromosome transmission fidelity protein 8
MSSFRVIPVVVEEGAERKWLLIELQGELRALDGQEADWSGKSLGKLMDQDSDNPVLIIGSHRLEGKRTKLAKPFAILKKQGDFYTSQGFVNEKLLFKTRPKPLTVGH